MHKVKIVLILKIAIYKDVITYLFAGLIMGPKSNKKAKNIKPTLPNPYMENIPQLGKEQIDKLLELLTQKLKNIYPPQVTNRQVMSHMEQKTKDNTDTSEKKYDKKERNELFKAKRKELRYENSSNLNTDLRDDITIGLKKCLKELSSDKLCVLLFDSTVNLEPMRCIFEKGQQNLNIIGIPNLGDSVKSSLGFSTICIGFKKIVKETVIDNKCINHFYPIVEYVSSFVESHIKVSKTICDIVKKETTVKTKQDDNMVTCDKQLSEKDKTEKVPKESREKENELPKIEILYRKDNHSRVFIPSSSSSISKNNLTINSDFISLSESPECKKRKMM